MTICQCSGWDNMSDFFHVFYVFCDYSVDLAFFQVFLKYIRYA